ncbi:hypothetical protein NEOLI_002220 [Neolecta irregularis DAH-3]|uniref:Uncharacterized protein n=1 Tax=Neolecta irregularis (strain DAH-3) TaxID=1198029 RepID=A0A1U7LHU1_NEOID|nr:hypothetical protein NEOLI_002220 [Neolecta irregularis DAH-3]|eukprot:OLL22163.1 hypothetical protein NEOLI_002220 [Neolecta irregularis DAH-3]
MKTARSLLHYSYLTMQFHQVILFASASSMLVAAMPLASPQALPPAPAAAVAKVDAMEDAVVKELTKLAKVGGENAAMLEKGVDAAKQLKKAVDDGDAEAATDILHQQEDFYDTEIRPLLVAKIGEEGARQLEEETLAEVRAEGYTEDGYLEKRFLEGLLSGVPIDAILTTGLFVVKSAVKLIGLF